MVVIDYQWAARPLDYARGMANTELVGRMLGHLLEQAHVQLGLQLPVVYLVGFSLGCQVSHFASDWLKEKLGQRVGRVTALDPAEVMTSAQQTKRGDGDFVDVIHTTLGFVAGDLPLIILKRKFSIVPPSGDIDFFPNGGTLQPACLGNLNPLCMHYLSMQYFINSFKTCKYPTLSCGSVDITASSLLVRVARERRRLREWATTPTRNQAAVRITSRRG